MFPHSLQRKHLPPQRKVISWAVTLPHVQQPSIEIRILLQSRRNSKEHVPYVKQSRAKLVRTISISQQNPAALSNRRVRRKMAIVARVRVFRGARPDFEQGCTRNQRSLPEQAMVRRLGVYCR